MTPKPKNPPKTVHEDRVAAALRENLLKRKQQQQARKNSDDAKTG